MDNLPTSVLLLGCVPTSDHLDLVGTVYDGDSYAVMDSESQVIWSDPAKRWFKIGNLPPTPISEEYLRDIANYNASWQSKET